MPVNEHLIREITALDSLIGESILLSPASREGFREIARTITDIEKIQALKELLSSQKQFILEYLRQSLKDGFSTDDRTLLLQDMQAAYLRKLRKEEELKKMEEQSSLRVLFENFNRIPA